MKSPLPKHQAVQAVQTTLESLEQQTLDFSVIRKMSSIPNAGNLNKI